MRKRMVCIAAILFDLCLGSFSLSYSQEKKTIILQQGLDSYQGCTGVLGGTGDGKTSWLRFDLSLIPEGAKVEEVKLSLFCPGGTHAAWRRKDKIRDVNNFAYGSMHNTWIYVVRLIEHKEPDSCCEWKRDDSFIIPDIFKEEPLRVLQRAKSDVVVASVEEGMRWYKWDLTEMVKWWLKNPEKNFGVAINQYTNEGYYGCGEDNNLQDDHKGLRGPGTTAREERPKLTIIYK